MENLILGFSVATTIINLIWCFSGVALGTLIGVLPGLGPMATISILLPLTYNINDPISSIIFLAGIFYGSQYGGSITSILLKLPGEASSTITVLDGYAMTKNGRSGAALTIAALSSFVGGTFATIVMAMLAEPLSEIGLLFGPADYASLMLLGLIACVSINTGGFFRGVIMILLGAFLGLVGTDINTGQVRFTAGIIHLSDGISFAILAMGVFGIGEVLYNIIKSKQQIKQVSPITSLYPTKKEFQDAALPTVRGSVLGTFLGLLPGGGTVLSSFFSYAIEKKVSKKSKNFGNGEVGGVAAPEAANNASAQSQFLPTLVLGIPFTPIMALIVSVLIVNGIQPGPNVISNNPQLFWGLIASMWIGNLILITLNIPLISIWVSILKIPKKILYPNIIIISIIGAYSINNNWFDIGLLFVFGALGLLIKLFKFEPAPLALSFVVIPMFEEYFRRALSISRGDLFVFIDRPISLSLLCIATTFIIFSIFKKK